MRIFNEDFPVHVTTPLKVMLELSSPPSSMVIRSTLACTSEKQWTADRQQTAARRQQTAASRQQESYTVTMCIGRPGTLQCLKAMVPASASDSVTTL
jgi:hypothetical protein